MIQKKICMLGAFAVGKTSLVSRFVYSIFSDKYHTTLGVKISKKQIRAGGRDVNLMLWDLAGEDEFQELRTSYLRGASGYLLVADGTRAATLDTAMTLREKASATVGDVPFVVVLNKSDLVERWAVAEGAVEDLLGRGWPVIRGSAKTGEGVEEAFGALAERMLA